MAFPIALVTALASLASAGIGGAQALFGGKPSEQEQEILNILQRRFEEGLTGAEESEFLRLNAPSVNRRISRLRSTVSSAFSGIPESSFALREVANVPTTEEILAPQLFNLDLAARTGAQGGLLGFQQALAGRRQGAIGAGLTGLVGGIGEAGAQFLPRNQMSLDELLDIIYGGRTLPNLNLPSTAVPISTTQNVGFTG